MSVEGDFVRAPQDSIFDTEKFVLDNYPLFTTLENGYCKVSESLFGSHFCLRRRSSEQRIFEDEICSTYSTDVDEVEHGKHK